MSEEYKLVTIKDIFEKVPADRIKDCMDELSVLLTQAKSMQGLINACGDAVSGEENSVETICPETFTWMDDGNGEVVSNFNMSSPEGDHGVISLKTSLEISEDPEDTVA